MEKQLVVNRPKIKLYHVGKTNRRLGFFEHDEFEKQLDALPFYAKLILRFGYYTGWREGEIFGLRWQDDGQGSGYYDERGQTVRLYNSKSGNGRVFPLRNRDGSLNDVGLVIEDAKHGRVLRSKLMFHNGRGRAVSRSTFCKHWHKACESSGVNRLFHDLRRTAVRNLSRAGVHRTVAKAITGHETDHVFERYDIVDEADLKAAITKMTSYLTSRNGQAAQTGAQAPEQPAQQPRERSERADERSEEATASGSEPATDYYQAQRCPSVEESQPARVQTEKLAATSAPTPATRATAPDDVFELMADLGVM
jgi:hypothetical protein